MEIKILKQRLKNAEDKIIESQVARLVYETQVQVASMHGFSVEEPVTCKQLNMEVLMRVFNDSVEHQYPGKMLDLVMWSYRLFDMVPDDYDLIREMRALLSEQVGGLYDPGTRTLFVHPDFELGSPLGRIILAHEICHAMQDQNFHLIDLGLEQTGNDDSAAALHALVEGDATLLMSEHTAEYLNPLAIILDLPKILSIDQQKFNESPFVVQEMFLFPYLGGSKFLTELGGRTRQYPDVNLLHLGPEWRNRIFESPPETTEMILHPEKYLEMELPADIPIFEVPEEGIHASNVIGEMGMILMLQPTLGRTAAEQAAAGWHGDRILLAENVQGTGRMLKWLTKWDSPTDANEFHDSMTVVFKALFPKGRWAEGKGQSILEFNGPRETIRLENKDETTIEIEGLFNMMEINRNESTE